MKNLAPHKKACSVAALIFFSTTGAGALGQANTGERVAPDRDDKGRRAST